MATKLMRVPTDEELTSFLAPLRGKVTIISFHDKDTKVRTFTFLTSCASKLKAKMQVLDMDAFCSIHVQRLVDVKNSEFPTGMEILLPIHGFSTESLASLIPSTEFLIIDDLNSLFSLSSASSQSHQLFAMMKLISYHARINDSWVLATAYRSAPTKLTKTNKHSLESLADFALEATSRDGAITLKGAAVTGWPDDGFAFETHLET